MDGIRTIRLETTKAADGVQGLRPGPQSKEVWMKNRKQQRRQRGGGSKVGHKPTATASQQTSEEGVLLRMQ